MSDQPLVSIIICVRNGMPHVREAVESVRAQTYGNYELVLQDGASTDGTREYLESLSGFASVSCMSAPDDGMGQGFNRALQRCRGAIIGSVDADNRLTAGAVDTAVRAFQSRPDAAVVYGACNMVDAQGGFLHAFIPAEFDLLGLLNGSVVPPFGTSYFSRRLCGDALYFDEDFARVPDFALWLRLADRPIHRIFDVLSEVRVSAHSSTYQPDDYASISMYKRRASARYLDGPGRDRVLDAVARRSEGGIYLWVVDSMHVIGGPQDQVEEYFAKALEGADIRSERFREVVGRARPRVRLAGDALHDVLLVCGREYLQKEQPDSALVYFELLERSGSTSTDLAALAADARRLSAEIHVAKSAEVVDRMQAEVDARDRILVAWQAKLDDEVAQKVALQAELDRRDRLHREMHDHLYGEVDLRDQLFKQMHDHLQGEVDRRDALIKAHGEKPPRRENALSSRILRRLQRLVKVSR